MRSRFLLLPFLLAAVVACDGDPSEPTDDGPSYDGMLLGGDISALARIEQWGGVFRKDGAPTDAIDALMDAGSNTFRLRLFVEPDGADVVVNDLDYTIALAQRVKAAGATLLLDFHYSDTWADPGKQYTPAAWDTTDIDVLEAQVEAYSGDVIAAMKAAGVLPDIVQIGNEIDGGLLWPLGRIGGEFSEPENLENFGRLLKAGIRGVRSALAPGDDVRIMIHYSNGASVSGTRWFFDHVVAQGVEFDMIGLSFYPFWHGPLSALRSNLHATAERYGRPIMVVETTYPWRSDWSPGAGAQPGWQVFPQTIQGQEDFLRMLVDFVAETPDDLGAGVLWWYPEAIQPAGHSVWGGGALALFNNAGVLLPAAAVFGN